VQIKHLAAPTDLVADGIDDDLLFVGFDNGLDRVAVGGSGLDDAEIAGAGERHVERARDRRGAHREHVDGGAHALEGLLVLHAEALLLVDDNEAEFAKFDVGLKETVSADEDIHLAERGGFKDLLLLGFGAEAADHFDGDGVAGHALAEGVEMLLSEDGGRDEQRDLTATLDGFEGGADGNLGFAETDVAADEPVHGRVRSMSALVSAMALSWSRVSV